LHVVAPKLNYFNKFDLNFRNVEYFLALSPSQRRFQFQYGASLDSHSSSPLSPSLHYADIVQSENNAVQNGTRPSIPSYSTVDEHDLEEKRVGKVTAFGLRNTLTTSFKSVSLSRLPHETPLQMYSFRTSISPLCLSLFLIRLSSDLRFASRSPIPNFMTPFGVHFNLRTLDNIAFSYKLHSFCSK